ncbi:MAG: Na+/H+ antiporter NhaC [Dehalobacterium sp.]
MTNNEKVEIMPSFTQACLIFLLIVGIILYATVVLKVSPHIPMFVCLVLTILLGLYLKYPWEEMQEALFKGIHIGLLPMLIMILIGMVIGSWIACGTIPYIIYLGIKFFSPQWFLVSVLLICSIMSLSTGSSWTTIGTLGVAFMAIGYGLGISPAITAGAVVSGAVFGDKQSPLSETTNFAPAVAETTLFNHVRSMLYSTTPAYIIALIIYSFIGLRYAGKAVDTEKITLMANTLQGAFNFNQILLLLPIFLIALVVKKVPALLGMGSAALLGLVFAIIFQRAELSDLINYMHYGYVGNTGVEVVDKLISKGGLNSMMWTISLMFFALSMGGVLERIGVLKVILNKLSNIVSSVFGLITTTLFSVLALEFVTADSYLPMLLSGRTFGPAFDRLHIDRKVLSRSLEDTGTLGSFWVPWSESGVFVLATLGVSAFDYLPYYFLGTITPLVSMVLAATGFGIWYTNKKENTKKIITDKSENTAQS